MLFSAARVAANGPASTPGRHWQFGGSRLSRPPSLASRDPEWSCGAVAVVLRDDCRVRRHIADLIREKFQPFGQS